MKVRIRNIGMLDEADFEVGDLTLICGENNTGKTYATYSLYGYLKYMRSMEKIFYRDRRILQQDEEYHKINKNEIKLSYEEIKRKLEKYISKKTKMYSKHILVESMAGEEDDFLNTSFDIEMDISMGQIKKALNDYLKSNDMNRREKRMFMHTIDNDGVSISCNDEMDFRYPLGYLKRELARYMEIFFDTLLNLILDETYILSVERTGASIFQDELDFMKLAQLEALQKILKGGETRFFGINIEDISDEKEQLYPKPVRDNIDFIRKIQQLQKKESIFKKNKEEYKIFFEILGKIVGGKYKATDMGILFQPKGSRKSYNIKIASSSVRSLLMLNYYVLHKAQRGDILMIDEPELNLHPNNQILIARLLVLLVNAGIKVFITTHSDYIVRELSNCIMLNNLSDEQLNKFKKQGYSKEYKLESNKVKAYLAQNIKGKNTLKEVEITQEQGIFMETFDAPIDSQNENQGLIFEEVIQSKEKK